MAQDLRESLRVAATTAAVFAVAGTALLPGRLSAQESFPLVGSEVALSDFGLDSAEAVLRGRIAVVHAPYGARAAVHLLRAEAPVAAPPAPIEPAAPRGRRSASPGGERHTALWVWTTRELVADPEDRASFLDLVEERGIDRVFLYLPAAGGEEPRAGYIPFDGAELGPLVAELRARGALTYALDGDPEYALPENHAGVLRTVSRVAEHNRSAPPEERFHGVRYDIEPYLARGFQGPERDLILTGYVELLARVSSAAHGAGLVFGVDIPFWFDGTDEETGDPFEAVLDGERRPILDHLLPLVDDVAIMAYRTNAYGPDGTLEHAAGELLLGGAAEVDVFVGVETTHLYDEEQYTFRGEARSGLPDRADAPWVVLRDRGEGLVTVYFVDGPEALAELRGEVDNPDTLRYWFAGIPVEIPGEKLSFHSLGPDAMEMVTDQILRELAGEKAFRGFAYHDYRGLKALLGGD